MADLGGGFDATTVAPVAPREPIPAGPYRCAIIDSEWKENSKRNGRYMQFTFEVLEGDHKGRRLWARLNMENPSADAVRIARAEMSALCHATGVLKPRDTSELHNIPLVVHVKVKRRSDNGELTNEIDTFESTEKAAEKAAQKAATAPGQNAAGTAGEPAPWD